MNATREKTRLWLLIFVGVVATLLGQTHAREIFAPSPHVSGVFAAQTQASTGENYDGIQYDALDSLLAAKAGAVADGSIYSTAFETTLKPTSFPGASRAAHFQEANEALLQSMEGSAEIASRMNGLGINLERTATGLAPRQSPAGWTWHHAPEPGVMQLVPRAQHAPGSIFQPTFHPGGQGGMAIWGR